MEGAGQELSHHPQSQLSGAVTCRDGGVRHFFKGNDLDPAMLEKALRLSDERYCSVLWTIKTEPEISSVFEIEA